MNIRSELRLEIVRDNMVFHLSIPANTTHDIAHSVCMELCGGILEMKKQAQEAQAKENPKAQEAQ